MLILLLLSNIGFIIGAMTRVDISTLARRLKNATAMLDDYPDYGTQQSRPVSHPFPVEEGPVSHPFPVEEEGRRVNVASRLIDQGIPRRRPQTTKFTDGQSGFISENFGNENRPYDWQGQIGSFIPHAQHRTGNVGVSTQNRILHNNRKSPASLGYSYAGYIERQARRYPIMMYTLVQCVPCQRAKHLLAVSYADVAAHFLEFAGHEDWQRQLAVDLIRITGQDTFPYIFICGQNIGGASDLFQLHQSGQLRSTLNNCT